jgi:hypothetical protein
MEYSLLKGRTIRRGKHNQRLRAVGRPRDLFSQQAIDADGRLINLTIVAGDVYMLGYRDIRIASIAGWLWVSHILSILLTGPAYFVFA